MIKSCHVCKNKIDDIYWLGKSCKLCQEKYEIGKSRAHSAVSKAIKAGKLKPVKELDCVDCGKQAKFYDHRNYNKPLDVVPVCHSCNLHRGHGIALNPESIIIKKYKERKNPYLNSKYLFSNLL